MVALTILCHFVFGYRWYVQRNPDQSYGSMWGFGSDQQCIEGFEVNWIDKNGVSPTKSLNLGMMMYDLSDVPSMSSSFFSPIVLAWSICGRLWSWLCTSEGWGGTELRVSNFSLVGNRLELGIELPKPLDMRMIENSRFTILRLCHFSGEWWHMMTYIMGCWGSQTQLEGSQIPGIHHGLTNIDGKWGNSKDHVENHSELPCMSCKKWVNCRISGDGH